ncbi:MAG: class I SAM-dependent methyltransferase, partial [Proteobacteria bacterium]|nr:class I SAM-dependent methyltransferase [Pseudomonadota bacterium]
MADRSASIAAHYGADDILERILAALVAAGADPDHPTQEQLALFDHMHGRGYIATREHVEQAGITVGMTVLDVGCGIGGPARYMAAVLGCTVSGIDLTPEYVEVGRELTRRCGLQDQVDLVQGNALDLPYDDNSFDHVYCHNVTMNIEDKAGLAAEIARVLKPGGQFSCAEVAQGPGGAPYFPLPWARDPADSFLVTPEAMKAALEAGGLRVIEQSEGARHDAADVSDDRGA